MDRFQHLMRTTQHTKSVQMIMTRTNYQFLDAKSSRKRPSPQGDNITTYLRKFQIEKQNLNLAKRIMQCQSQHSKQKYNKEWEKIQRFLRVRSNFKRTLNAQEPKIFRFQPILGKGRLKVDFQIKDVEIQSSYLSKKNLYRFSFVLGNNQIEPDKKLITPDFMKTYSTCFYAPLFLKKKKIISKIYHIHENNYYEVGRFQVDFAEIQTQQTDILNKLGKPIGKVKFHVHIEGGRKKLQRKFKNEKQNHIYLNETQDSNSKDEFMS